MIQMKEYQTLQEISKQSLIVLFASKQCFLQEKFILVLMITTYAQFVWQILKSLSVLNVAKTLKALNQLEEYLQRELLQHYF
jgi:hypothetical protein